MRILRIATGCLLMLSATAYADIYDQAQMAEERQQWEEAIRLYEQVVEKNPEHISAWRRMSDIHARRGEPDQAAEALEQAARIAGDDVALFVDASAAYAEAGNRDKALEMIERATDASPEQADHWAKKGELAAWAGLTERAVSAYSRALELDPERKSLLLPLGLNEAWSGNLNEAVTHVRGYLEEYPDQSGAWLHLADFEIWRGNYAGGLSALNEYSRLEGEDEAFMKKRARIMAWAGRTDASMGLVEPLLAEQPDDTDVHYTRTLALRLNRPEEAMESLRKVEAADPDASEVIDLRRSTRLPYRPRVTLDLNHFEDSDNIRFSLAELHGSYHLDMDTELVVGLHRRRAKADAGSGFESIDGSERTNDSRIWAGLGRRLGSAGWVDLRLGRDDVDDHDSLTSYGIGLDWRFSDSFSARIDHNKELVAISPRTVSQVLNRKRTDLGMSLRPDLQNSIDISLGYQDFSDGNTRRNLDAAYRYAAVRRQSWNVDLGVAGGWFSYREDPDNGYYAPSRYRHLALTTGAYWKLSDDDGISINIALGGQKDETFSSVKFYGDASVEGIFGIYRDWMLRVRAAYSDRRQQTGGFDATRLSLSIERRF